MSTKFYKIPNTFSGFVRFQRRKSYRILASKKIDSLYWSLREILYRSWKYWDAVSEYIAVSSSHTLPNSYLKATLPVDI
jgi:hypothetical protein